MLKHLIQNTILGCALLGCVTPSTPGPVNETSKLCDNLSAHVRQIEEYFLAENIELSVSIAYCKVTNMSDNIGYAIYSAIRLNESSVVTEEQDFAVLYRLEDNKWVAKELRVIIHIEPPENKTVLRQGAPMNLTDL